MWRGLSAMVVIFVSPHLAHVLDHGGRERRHVHRFRRALCRRRLRRVDSYADKQRSENEIPRSEDIGANRNPWIA
jgi:hypothetical protein